MAVAITRTELSAEELRAAARGTKDNYQARRLLALALVLDGASRTAAAQAAGMDRQTLRDWVHRYNAEGVQGLCDRARSGRPPRLSEAQLAELVELVEAGPDPARHGVVRWRCLDLRAEIKQRFEVEISERHVGRLLKRLGFTRLSVRPRHPRADQAAQQAFKTNFAEIVSQALPATARDKPLEIWFQDEARIGQKGTLTRIWARIGTRPPGPRDSRYEWAYIFAAVCPERATGAALVMPYANTEAMNLHLHEISRTVAPGAHAVLVFDGAGWHTSPALKLPHNITPVCLPPYAPEPNPTENIWQYLRKNYLALRVLDDYDAIVDACCKAWNDLIALPDRLASITRRNWAKVS